MVDADRLKQVLKHSKTLPEKIRETHDHIEALRSKAEIKVVKRDETGVIVHNNRDFMGAYVSIDEELRSRLDRLHTIRAAQLRMLIRVIDIRHSDIFFDYYSTGKSMTQIAEEKQYDRRTIYRIINDGLFELSGKVTESELEELEKMIS